MKRLTTQIEKIRIREDSIQELQNTISIEELQQHYIEIFDKLQEYEVEEENDMLLHLPCEIGHTIYGISRDKIIPLTIEEIRCDKNGLNLIGINEQYYGYGKVSLDSNNEFGMEWYETKEEAEKALEEKQ